VAGDHTVADDRQRVQQVARLGERRVDVGALTDDLRKKRSSPWARRFAP